MRVWNDPIFQFSSQFFLVDENGNVDKIMQSRGEKSRESIVDNKIFSPGKIALVLPSFIHCILAGA